MCGIVGFANAQFQAEQIAEILTDAMSMISHRGPDGAGYVIDDSFAMGTVRLAILDTESGIQPISDETSRYWLCYNGEVYNYRELRVELEARGYRFQTNCDTEVVLYSWLEWQEACLERFNGGFAFALFDRRTKRLVLARDRYGKRPLFYTRLGESILFASEMKAFMAIPGFNFEQDPSQLASILAQWTPLAHQSGFKNIASLEMGHYLVFQEGELSIHCYNQILFESNRRINSEQEAIESIRSELDQSVAFRLRSDVEVGVYLSGGVDSAIVARLASNQTNKELFTFSVSFEDEQFDESSDQEVVSRYLGTKHLTRHIGYQDIVEAFPMAIYHAEVPAFRSAFVPMFLLSKLTSENDIKVILSGEGADEAFLGYDLFKETILRSQWDQLGEKARSELLATFYPHLSHYASGNKAAVTGVYQQFSKEHMKGLFSHELRFQNGKFSTRLLKPELTREPFAEISSLVESNRQYASMNPIKKAQWLEYKTLLPGYLLSTQGERMSLAHSVENRCVFLDPAVIDVANATNLKFDNGFREKRLLREAFRKDLPSEIIEKRKFPYRAPDTEAFISLKPDYLDMILASSELSKLSYINEKFVGLLTNKLMKTASDKISTKEHQSFIFLLSMAMIHHKFVENKSNLKNKRKLAPLQRTIDLRIRVPKGI